MNLDLSKKVVILAGGAGVPGSIGETMLQHLVSEDAIPAILDISERGSAYVQEHNNKGNEALFVKTDLTKPEQVENAISIIIAKYGRIDAVINNVGVNDSVAIDGDYDDFMNSIKLNLVSYWLTVKYALPALKKSKGTILNIGSKVGITGQGGTSAYAAAKGGVLALTREWAVDLVKDRIRVNAIVIAESWTPAYDQWIKTLSHGEEKLKSIVGNIPLENRMTTPQEISNTALFLLSSLSSHTTGQFVFVDGGYVHLDRALLSK